jgi:predicted dehydrogenase
VIHRVAVVGSGHMARKHLGTLAPRTDVRLVCLCATARSEHAAREVGAEFGIRRVTSSYDEVLADDAVDVVWICTPDDLHAEQAAQALAAGKDVFCEKPLARRREDFERIGRLLAESSATLAVGMNCRFRGQYGAVKQAVASGELGDLRFLRGTYVVNAVETTRARVKPWVLSSPPGVHQFLQGGGLHTLDLMRWIGGDVVSVFARATGFELRDEWELDTFSVSLEFASGVLGEVLVSAAAFRPDDFSLEAWGSEGAIVGRAVYRRRGDGVEEARTLEFEQPRLDLELQADNVFGGAPLNSFAEARANFAVLDAAERSIASGRSVALEPAALSQGAA